MKLSIFYILPFIVCSLLSFGFAQPKYASQYPKEAQDEILKGCYKGYYKKCMVKYKNEEFCEASSRTLSKKGCECTLNVLMNNVDIQEFFSIMASGNKSQLSEILKNHKQEVVECTIDSNK